MWGGGSVCIHTHSNTDRQAYTHRHTETQTQTDAHCNVNVASVVVVVINTSLPGRPPRRAWARAGTCAAPSARCPRAPPAGAGPASATAAAAPAPAVRAAAAVDLEKTLVAGCEKTRAATRQRNSQTPLWTHLPITIIISCCCCSSSCDCGRRGSRNDDQPRIVHPIEAGRHHGQGEQRVDHADLAEREALLPCASIDRLIGGGDVDGMPMPSYIHRRRRLFHTSNTCNLCLHLPTYLGIAHAALVELVLVQERRHDDAQRGPDRGAEGGGDDKGACHICVCARLCACVCTYI